MQWINILELYAPNMLFVSFRFFIFFTSRLVLTMMSLISILEDSDQDRNVPATNCQVHIQENDNDDDEAEKHGKQRSDVTLPSGETKP